MKKCDNFHEIESKRYVISDITGIPKPVTIKYGVCMATKEIEVCRCDGDEVICDLFPEKRSGATGRGCGNCKHFNSDDEDCRLMNCHRAFTVKELEDKTFVTDAWEKQ